MRLIALLPVIHLLLIFPLHCTMVTSTAYSSPSIVLASRRPDGSQVRFGPAYRVCGLTCD